MTFSFDRGHGRTRLAPAALVPIALWCALGVCAEPLRTSHSVVELIVEQESLPAEGGTVTAGLYLKPDSGWHAYWSNPGDAGKEASIRWSLPDGLEAGPLQFPAPHLIPFGEFNTYGFDEAILLLVDITVPAGTEAGRVVELAGRASWVVCDDELCIPERAEVGVTLRRRRPPRCGQCGSIRRRPGQAAPGGGLAGPVLRGRRPSRLRDFSAGRHNPGVPLSVRCREAARPLCGADEQSGARQSGVRDGCGQPGRSPVGHRGGAALRRRRRNQERAADGPPGAMRPCCRRAHPRFRRPRMPRAAVPVSPASPRLSRSVCLAASS